MSSERKPLTVSGFPVELVRIGRNLIGQITIDDNIAALVRLKDEQTLADEELDCTACRISNISSCTNAVCPGYPPEECPSRLERCLNDRCPQCLQASASNNIMILM